MTQTTKIEFVAQTRLANEDGTPHYKDGVWEGNQAYDTAQEAFCHNARFREFTFGTAPIVESDVLNQALGQIARQAAQALIAAGCHPEFRVIKRTTVIEGDKTTTTDEVIEPVADAASKAA